MKAQGNIRMQASYFNQLNGEGSEGRSVNCSKPTYSSWGKKKRNLGNTLEYGSFVNE